MKKKEILCKMEQTRMMGIIRNICEAAYPDDRSIYPFMVYMQVALAIMPE